jgi:hypothetical protein
MENFTKFKNLIDLEPDTDQAQKFLCETYGVSAYQSFTFCLFITENAIDQEELAYAIGYLDAKSCSIYNL